MVEQYTIHRNT